MPRLTIRPCANCARPISEGVKVFCCDLCSEVPSTIRYIRRTAEDGRIDSPDVREAIDIKIALIMGGGYPKSARKLAEDQRDRVKAEAQGKCTKCGAPGTEIDHIRGSSSEASNLQLLCRDCHLKKTHEAMGPASPELVEGVYRPILRRARNENPNQPCDSTAWDHRKWATTGPKFLEMAKIWSSEFIERSREEQNAPSKFDAAEGFPRYIDPWTWYSV